ncbi:MAG: UDP-3-O-(3-hydroxymyristoyl)glucosamine N-acyltransferase [Hyphomicrobiales bacterium]|nr:UDP-3-O-(3-hydroxymyristoyl)glucosamine N-acyltransferase [Hyphomicrobiales bacterium]
MKLTLAQLAACCEGEIVGSNDITLDGVSNLSFADKEKISFYSDKKYADDLAHTRAGAVITSPSLADHYSGNKIIVANPLLALARIITAFQAQTLNAECVAELSASASIASGANLGDSVSVGANAVIGHNTLLGNNVSIGSGAVIGTGVSIGENTRIDANVTIYDGCQLGSRCHVSAGTVIGSDGFGFAETSNEQGPEWVAVPQIASVVIGDGVHIGANTSIDRGSLEDTVIGDGVIIDNLVQIAHNVTIGRHTAIAGCAGIAGSAHIGQRCKIGGRASILGHIDICDDVIVFADSYVTKSIAVPGIYSAALPAMPIRQWQKLVARLRRG